MRATHLDRVPGAAAPQVPTLEGWILELLAETQTCILNMYPVTLTRGQRTPARLGREGGSGGSSCTGEEVSAAAW